MKILRCGGFIVLVLGLAFGLLGGAAFADDSADVYLQELQTQMTSPMMQGTASMDDMGQITACLDAMDEWARLVNIASRHQFTVDEYATVTAFKDKARLAQSRLFPMLRQALGFALQKELGGVKVNATGDNFREIRFTSPKFIDMGETQAMNDRLAVLLKRLRFGQSVFMLDHEDISTLARFNPPQDADIVLWDAEYRQYSLFN